MSAKVLVVDDSILVRHQVARALSGIGIETIEASNGVDALATLELHANIGLAICDVNMPRMSGLDFIEAARRLEAFATIPVIVLSNESQRELILRASSLNVCAWLRKPFRPELFRSKVRELLGAETSSITEQPATERGLEPLDLR